MLLRLLAETASANGSAARRDPAGGNWSFPVAANSVEKITLDFTGWLGGATVSAQSFVSSDVTLASVAESGGVVTALATIPAAQTTVPPYLWVQEYQLVHSCTASDGRKRITTFNLVSS